MVINCYMCDIKVRHAAIQKYNLYQRKALRSRQRVNFDCLLSWSVIKIYLIMLSLVLSVLECIGRQLLWSVVLCV